ncbi:hypothetical protein BGZ80_001281 [Entomortierella chlamydospora]|uniref:Uncharacterized protein n=1 Tax=Entomortierella chlamydospora TaxID=101097 RepID=A0A9P6N2C3_9FUNG|nr:hypothetical protein BGZ80_001281 [Entomortierella chlamydospora]
MQCDEGTLEMPGSFKPARDHNTFENDENEIHNGNSSIAYHTPPATVMRASSVANPHESDFDISNSPTSGSPDSYDIMRYGASNSLHSQEAKRGHSPQLSLVDTVKAGATSTANSAAAAGASVIDAAKKFMNLKDDDEENEFDPYDGNEGVLPTTNYSAGPTRKNDNSHGLEFSHRSMANQSFALPVLQSTSTEPTIAASIPEVKRIPIDQPSPEPLSPHYTHTNNNNDIYASAAAGTAAVAGGLGVASIHHGHQSHVGLDNHSESVMNRARDTSNTLSIPKDNTFLVALTQAKVLLAQQEFLKRHHSLTPSMESTSASYNAPKENIHNRDHNHPEAAVVAAPVAVTTAAGVANNLRSWKESPTEDELAPVPAPAPVPSMDRVAHDTKTLHFTDPSTLRPLTEIRTFPTVEETHKPTLVDRVKDAIHRSSEYGPADPNDLTFTDPKTIGLLDRELSVPAAVGTTAGVVGAGEAIKAHSTATRGPVSDNSLASEASHDAFPADPVAAISDNKTLVFSDPKALRPVAEIRAFPVAEDTYTLTDKVKDIVHRSSEYGPADSGELQLTDPRTLGRLGEKAVVHDSGKSASRDVKPAAIATAAAGTAVATGVGVATMTHPKVETAAMSTPVLDSKTLNFTDPTTLRPLTEVRTVPPVEEPQRRSLMDKARDVTHSSFEYGPADPSHLQLTDPRSLGRMGTAAGAPVFVVPPPQPPADMKTLEFTDPKTLRPLTELRILTVVEETHKSSLVDKVRDALRRSSEYGLADPMDLQLTDPRTLRPLGEKAAAPVAAPEAVPISTATRQADTAASSHMTDHHDHSSAKPSIAAASAGAAVAVGTAGTAAMATPKHVVSPVQATTQTPMRTEISAPPRPATTTTSATTSAPDADNVNLSDIKSIQPSTDSRTIPPRPSEYGSADPRDEGLADTRPLHPMRKKVDVPAKEDLVGSQSTRSDIPTLAPLPAVAPLDIPLAHGDKTEDSMARRPLSADAAKPAPVPAPRPRRSTNAFANPITTGGAAAVVDSTAPDATSTMPTVANRSTNPFAATADTDNVDMNTNIMDPDASVAPPKMSHPEIHNTNMDISAAGVAPTMPQSRTQADNAGTYPTHQNHYTLTDNSIAAESPSSSASVPANTLATVPENHDGPIPKVQPGEENAWMKTTSTPTYPQDQDGAAPATTTSATSSTDLSPAQTQKLQQQQEGSDSSPIQSSSTKKKRRFSGFFSRLFHRHKTTDKGKQRM